MARELEKLGPLPWKPHVNVFRPIAEQCRLGTASNCGRWLLYDLLSGTKEARKASAIFLEQPVHLGEVGCGCYSLIKLHVVLNLVLTINLLQIQEKGVLFY